MARLYRDLCDLVSTIPNVNFTATCDPATMKFSLAEKDAVNIAPPDVTMTTTSPSNMMTATSHTRNDGEPTIDTNGHHSDEAVSKLNSEDQKGDAGDLDAVSSGGEDMEGYESDTSSSSSSSGEDVVVEGYGDSGEEGEEQLTEEEEEEGEGEEDALVTESIQQLKVSSLLEQACMYIKQVCVWAVSCNIISYLCTVFIHGAKGGGGIAPSWLSSLPLQGLYAPCIYIDII